jgi:hypothetical protein
LGVCGEDRRNREGKLDSSIHLWELASGQELGTLAGREESALEGVAFSPDGRLLASGSALGKAVLVWDVATGRMLRQLQGHLGAVHAVAFTPDGRSIVSGSVDSTAIVWEVSDLCDAWKSAVPLPAEAIERAWNDLASDDARTAHRASMALSVPSTVPFLRKHLPPAEAGIVGSAAAKVGPVWPADILRRLCAIAVLERIGSVESGNVVQLLTQGHPEAIETEEAQSTLKRLSQRPN